jgi:tetratricopeptide (TPR) repeat protein
MELARRFEDLRVRAGLTKTALAKPRYTVSYVSQIESGRRTPSSEAMGFFAGRLGVSADYLATGVPEDLDARLHYELETCRAELRSGMASEAEARSRAVLADAEHHGRDRLRALAQVELARALSARGAMHECVDAYEAAMEGPLSERERGRAVSGIGTAYRAVGDLTYAAEYIESYLGTRKGEPLDPQVAAELQSILVSIYFERGDVFRSERAARRALAAAESDSSPDSRALALWNASRVLAESRQWDEALELATRARILMEEADDRRRVAQLHNAYAFICLEADPPHVEEARHHLDRAETLLAELASPTDLAYVRTERSRLALLEGNPEVALANAEQALSEVGGDELETARCLFLKGRALGELGRADEARGVLVEAAALFGVKGARQQEASCWRELGELHLSAGDTEAAVDALRQGLQALDPKRSRA